MHVWQELKLYLWNHKCIYSLPKPLTLSAKSWDMLINTALQLLCCNGACPLPIGAWCCAGKVKGCWDYCMGHARSICFWHQQCPRGFRQKGMCIYIYIRVWNGLNIFIYGPNFYTEQGAVTHSLESFAPELQHFSQSQLKGVCNGWKQPQFGEWHPAWQCRGWGWGFKRSGWKLVDGWVISCMGQLSISTWTSQGWELALDELRWEKTCCYQLVCRQNDSIPETEPLCHVTGFQVDGQAWEDPPQLRQAATPNHSAFWEEQTPTWGKERGPDLPGRLGNSEVVWCLQETELQRFTA